MVFATLGEARFGIVSVLVAGGVGAALAALSAHSTLRRREARTRQAERRAADAVRLAELGSMTSGLAHEIKNPLSTIALHAQLLREDVLDSAMKDDERERVSRRVDSLAQECTRLKDILEDFLRFAGRVKLDPHQLDLRDVVLDLADFFEPQCRQAGVLLRKDLAPAPVMARVDSGLLKQALLNLALNAVQAMKDPSPGAAPGELILRLESGPDGVIIHVIDTGPGIAPERRAEVFQPYVTSKPGGSGLGLAVARRIVEEHGGRIELHSEPGRGSDFAVHLPLAAG